MLYVHPSVPYVLMSHGWVGKEVIGVGEGEYGVYKQDLLTFLVYFDLSSIRGV